MIFMSQSGMRDPQRQAAWDAWYIDHLKVMLTVDGIDSAQRFKLIDGDNSPSLAIYTIASQEVFQDDYYLSIRGMGEWLPLIDRRYYKRNVFAGLDVAPEIANEGELWVADCDTPDANLTTREWIWLKSVGLDGSPRYRGLAPLTEAHAGPVNGAGISRYRAVTERLTS